MQATSALALGILLGVSLASTEHHPPLPAAEGVRTAFVHDSAVYAVESSCSFYRGTFLGDGVVVRRFDVAPLPSTDFPPRWKIGFGEIFFVNADQTTLAATSGLRKRDMETVACPLDGLAERLTNPGTLASGEGVFTPSAKAPYRFGSLSDLRRLDNPVDYVYDAIRNYVNDKNHVLDDQFPFRNYEFFYDFMPFQEGECEYFLLASEALQREIEKTRVESGGRNPPAILEHGSWRKADDPLKPLLGLWRKSMRGQWMLADRIKTPCFNERFHVFVERGDWFFVTDSGKVYLSRKPAEEGGARKLEAIWDDAKRPVAAAVTDTASHKTFLFGRPADKDAKPFYFELTDKPAPVEFDPGVVKPLKAPEPLKTVMEYARFLADEKQIKLEKK